MLKKSLATLTFVAVLSGCQSTSVDDLQSMDCYYPDAPAINSPEIEAPQWVCGLVTPKGLAVSSVGYAKKSLGGLSIMNNISATNARAELARIFKTTAQSQISNALTANVTNSSVESESTETATQITESIEKNISSFVLTNSRIFARKKSPSGGLFTLVGMDQATYDDNLKKLVNQTTASDPELWNKFNDTKTNESLSDTLSKLLK